MINKKITRLKFFSRVFYFRCHTVFVLAIYLLYCAVWNTDTFGFTIVTSSFLDVISSAVAICTYQILLEKHLKSVEQKNFEKDE